MSQNVVVNQNVSANVYAKGNVHPKHVALMAEALSLKEWQIEQTVQLLEEGGTIPFISRYRKEMTGSLDEVQIAAIKMLHEKYEELRKRKEAILKSIEEQGKLSDELRRQIEECYEMNRLEDLYLPYRPKRRTRASIAREKGLEPLSELLASFDRRPASVLAESFLNDKVSSVEEALAGARDIIAEQISERADIRDALRRLYQRDALVYAKLVKSKEKEAENFQNYFDFKEPIKKIPSHRLLAILRGHAEGFLTVRVETEAVSDAIAVVERFVYNSNEMNGLRSTSQGLQSTSPSERGRPFQAEGGRPFQAESGRPFPAERGRPFQTERGRSFQAERGRSFPAGEESSLTQVKMAMEDSYKRLIQPSIENESINVAKENADAEAIKVFANNLTQLLLASPLGQKRVLAIDPGFRTGCKVVCLDAQGNLLHNDTIYPHPPQNERSQAMKKIVNLVESYKMEVIAVGNGTAGRETEQFLKKIAWPHEIKVYAVSEDGASVYSASSIAREEFPDYDVTVRGAVSIGRRIMDPLAELVKIDPKAIGVGQYQHDVDQRKLKESLDQTVEYCVNHVGVNLNTASKHLLTYVSGLGPQLAQNIVDYRTQNGAFTSRSELKKVKRLGEKAYEQCAGFLRIPEASYPLDNSAVHPERYLLVEQMAEDVNASISELLSNEALRKQVVLARYVSDNVGMPTLKDIMEELAKPGRDPRASIKVLEFSDEITSIENVRTGMVLPGIVTNITNFGAFVDIGIKQDGLVHISQIADKYVTHPGEVLKLHQHVKVKVVDVDRERQRIQLSMRSI